MSFIVVADCRFIYGRSTVGYCKHCKVSVLRTATNISMFGHYNPTTKFPGEKKHYTLICEFGTL